MNEPRKPFVLTTEQRGSALWRQLMEHMQGRLDEARQQNDGDLPEAQTARLRGRISELKTLIALNKIDL